MASMPQNPPRPPPPCPSWVFSNTSDTHVAKDRCWFGKDYIPFRSYVTDITGGPAVVIGMGTVNLATMSSPTQTDSDSHSSLCLKNVLHAPAMLCNIIGSPVEDDYTVFWGGLYSSSDKSGEIMSKSGRTVAYFKPMGQGPSLYQVQFSRPPLGYQFGISPLLQNGLYMIHAFWPQPERQRFALLKASGLIRASGVEPLTRSEKQWFGKRRMSENGILVEYGLNKNRKEHQEEGRAIMRILKSQAENELII
ncbi:hypothetical protein N7517_001463 [Penicillium concentricum]|uniref:Uncharacterized protein n=1 Tax=Penicillium concentricum TaxID=293559 RepID=A0A9W9SS28_9EURO|nr:uncharacterized protein N7517_001463 [Penicillium concentricum]KAJ5383552.1 hypothetical protein N7517_001463 [Penicillium concentricum]